MHEVFNELIERIMEETGYDYNYVVERYNEAMSQGVSVIDFFDNIVDGALYGV